MSKRIPTLLSFRVDVSDASHEPFSESLHLTTIRSASLHLNAHFDAFLSFLSERGLTVEMVEEVYSANERNKMYFA